jgi:hypothetical protein
MTRRRILAILLSGLACLLYWPSGVLAASSELVMISEVQLQGLSAKDEFVEIYNDGEANFDLTNCQLKKFTASGTGYLLHRFVAGAQIVPKGFYVVGGAEWTGEADERYSTSQSLANDNSLQLICEENILDLVGWGNVNLFEGQVLAGVVNSELWSYQRSTKLDTDNNFLDFVVETPCARCAFLAVDANESSGNVINENLEQTETVEVSDEGNSSDANQSEITVEDSTDNTIETTDVELAPVLESVTEESVSPVQVVVENNPVQNYLPVDSQFILLSELYPAPNSGESEYIEIYNAGDLVINLNNWFLTDLSEKKFVFKDVVLEPEEYYLLYYAKSKITLNNDEDQINLYNSAGQWRQGVRYVKAQKGKALFLDNVGQWRWGESSPGFINPEFVEMTNNSSELESTTDQTTGNNNVVSVVVADPAPVLNSVSGEISQSSVNTNTTEKIDETKSNTKVVSTKKSKEYQFSNLAAWSNWKANDLVWVNAQVLLDSTWGVTNRCFLGQGNYAVPVLCTTLKDKFVLGKNVSVKAKVYFKDGKFQYLKVEEVLPYNEIIDLEFKDDKTDLGEYQLWQGSGIVDELNSSRRLGKLGNESDVWVFRFPKGNKLAVGDQVFWQAVQWKGENYFFLTKLSGKIETESLDSSVDSISEIDDSEASAAVVADGKWFSAAAGGLGGSCYAVWRWRAVFTKLLPRIFM